MEHNNYTSDGADRLQPKRPIKEIDGLDAENFAHDAVDALYAFIAKDDIAPAVFAQWIAGLEYLRVYWNIKEPEHQPSRRLAYLWMLDALIASPDAITASLREARDKLIEL